MDSSMDGGMDIVMDDEWMENDIRQWFVLHKSDVFVGCMLWWLTFDWKQLNSIECDEVVGMDV